MDHDYSPSAKQAFYLIPDISGFSGFVENTAIEHSIHIISELLEILLDNNILNLKLVEIEGDALFMYSEKDLKYNQIEEQTSRMLNAFRNHLQKYETQRICYCGACATAIDLKIKFLVHFGRLDFIHVKNIKKPYGKDVNRIHRLLKNDVPLNEYLLLSNPAFYHFNLNAETSGFIILENSSYDIKILPYFYKDLKSYKLEIPREKLENSKIESKEEADLTIERKLAVPIEALHNLIRDFRYRKLWDESLTDIKFDGAKVNRLGSRHTCIIGNLKMNFKTIENRQYKAEQAYGESTENLPMTKAYKFYILLDAVNSNTTNVRVINIIKLTWLGWLMKKSVFKKIKKNWAGKLKNLEELGQKFQTNSI